MKKTVKKLVILIAVVMTAMLCLAFSASAETWGDYEYWSDYETGNITLIKYNGKATSVTIPSKINGKPVVVIDAAFSGNEKIKSVTIPNTVTTIAWSAFRNCDALTSITIPNSVTFIGEYAFFECDALTSITIPNSVTSIGDWAFSNCVALTSITIPNSVTSIGNAAFGDCDALKSITIPNSVTSIVGHAFYDCDSLTSITIPNSVTTIGDSAFRYCSALSEVTLGNNVKKIGGSAFSSCNELEEITIPASVKSIGTGAFLGVESGMDLTVLLCPKGSYASKWAKKAGQPYVITNPSGNENIVKGRIGKFNWSVDKLSGELKLTGSGKMNYFTDISAPWYEYRYYIKSISLPKGLTEIGDNSFKRLYRIRSIKIPGTVKTIGNYAFAGCNNLKNAVLNKGVTTLEAGAFEDCRSLERVTIPNGITSISGYAFSGCISLAGITIPNGVTSIGSSAFNDCISLASITIPKSVTTIGYMAFANCKSLKSITIPSNIKTTNGSWFSGCINLKKVILENGVEKIGEETFRYSNDNLEVVVKNKNCVFDSRCGLNYNHTIWGYKGSTAEAYADEIGARFIDINHKHVYKNKTTKATLTKNGKLESVCKVCGKVSKTTAIYYPKSIKLSATSFTYNGKAISPAVTVKDSKGNVLKKGTDYTVVYSSGRTNPGSYVAKVTFKGKYSGVQRITFTIKPSTPAITAVASTVKGRVAVAWKNVVGETGYQVYYSTKKDSGYKAFMTSKADVVKVAKNGLASGKTYYFKVRAYKTVSGTSIYSAWSSAKAVKIK